jgi:transcriptional regulator with XRE-family HTH domain
MDAARLIRTARRRAGVSLRQLARRARTSHATLAAYERGTKTPSVATLTRIIRAAGFELEVGLLRAVDPDPETRGRELEAALELAAQFPARKARAMAFPKFRRA